MCLRITHSEAECHFPSANSAFGEIGPEQGPKYLAVIGDLEVQQLMDDDLPPKGGGGWYRGRWRDIRRSAEHSAETRHPGLGHQHAGHERRTYERYYQATVSEPGVLPELIF